LMLKNFVGGDLLKVDLGGGIMDSVSGAFNQLTGTLKSMQAQIKADTLMKIAIAMGLLTVSIVALSLIDSKKLTKSLAGVAVSFGMMQVALAKLSSSVSLFGTAKLPVITASLIMLAGALVILSIAVTQLSKLNLEQLAKGLGAVAVLLRDERLQQDVLERHGPRLRRTRHVANDHRWGNAPDAQGHDIAGRWTSHGR
jgi:hypothetical protein